MTIISLELIHRAWYNTRRCKQGLAWKQPYFAPHDTKMALAKDEKVDVIKKFAREKGDTGSPEVQIALLSIKIDKLVGHLKEHKKDVHSRRGLLSMVAKRRRLLSYLHRRDEERYKKLLVELKLDK